MTERFRLPPVVTASKWSTLWGSVWEALQRRGTVNDQTGTVAPKMTNREAIALVSALRALAPTTSRGWPHWYLFAAEAYGWNPTTNKLDTSSVRADRTYDPDASVELMLAMQRMMAELDDERPTMEPRIELDAGDFGDVLMQGDTMRALVEDGATLELAGVRTTPWVKFLCRDKSTGRLRIKRPPCDKDGKGPKWFNPVTGKVEHVACDKPGECVEPKTPLVDFVERNAGTLIVVGVLAYLFAPAVVSGATAGAIARRRQPRRRRPRPWL